MIPTINKAMPINVAAAFTKFPLPVRQRLEWVRALIFTIASESECIGPLTETLKWGDPAYLTEVTGSGSTIRLGWPKISPDHAAVYFNCKTILVQTFREKFPSGFGYSDNRAILLAIDKPMNEDALSLCVQMALTYHIARNPWSSSDMR